MAQHGSYSKPDSRRASGDESYSKPGPRRASDEDMMTKTEVDFPRDQEKDHRVKTPSKYDIYSETTKPFGETYRRSLHQLYPETEDKPAEHTNNETNGNYSSTTKSDEIRNEEEINNRIEIQALVKCELKETENQEVISKEDNENDVEKRETINNKNEIVSNGPKLDLRQALMKEIRDRRSFCEEKESAENEGCKTTQNYFGFEKPKVFDAYLDEEYSYEPSLKENVSGVVKARSMTNIQDSEEVEFKNTLNNTLTNSKKIKITTGPDGTFRYGSRKASVDSNLLEDDSDITPPSEDFIKNSYVSNLKNAYDAIEDNARKESGRLESFDGLRHYLHDNRLGLQELLINNNVVIIEPYREENRRSSFTEHRSPSCRITGATVKTQDGCWDPSNTLPRSTKTQKLLQSRNAFYHPIKQNRELVDSELPDPETVKQAREMFQRVVKSSTDTDIPLPRVRYNTINPRMRVTPEVRVVVPTVHKVEKKRQGRYIMEDTRQRYSPRRWTDTGSLSSGVSSDFSYEPDIELHQEASGLESFSSEDDDYQYPEDHDRERHLVSPEVMQKIRACGTSVTYYGGKVISHSDGPIRSPMTMTIMDEIRRATEERKDQYLGVKFRLVKSNSCGSRLEIAGTEEDVKHRESVFGKTITEDDDKTITEEDESDDAVEADRYPNNVTMQTWSDKKMADTRKQWHCDPGTVSRGHDMEFETFEVLEDGVQIKQDSVVGRG